MTTADEVHLLAGGDLFWQAYEPSVKCDLTSCAIRLPGRGREALLIDPIELSAEAQAELHDAVEPVAIVLTNGNHQRASARWAKRLGVPVYAHRDAEGEVDATHWIEPAQRQLLDLDVVELTGGGPGEIALFREANGGTVIFGDAVINLEHPGFGLLPEKYCSDQRALRERLTDLVKLQFERGFFAHGTPVMTGARDRLAGILQ